MFLLAWWFWQSGAAEAVLMSRPLRRWVEASVVFWCPWVMLLEQEPVTLEFDPDAE